jgi:hypothetical protein
MAYRPMTTLRNAVTALVLSVVALVGAEVWLRGKTLPAIQGVTAQAATRRSGFAHSRQPLAIMNCDAC